MQNRKPTTQCIYLQWKLNPCFTHNNVTNTSFILMQINISVDILVCLVLVSLLYVIKVLFDIKWKVKYIFEHLSIYT